MCVTWFKITFRAHDRCVADCWVAARLKRSPPSSPVLFLSLFLPLLGWRAVSDIRCSLREMRRACHSLSRGDVVRQKVTHMEMSFPAVHCFILAVSSETGMRNALYEKWLPLHIWPRRSLPLTPTSYKSYSVAMSRPLHLPHIQPSTRMCFYISSHRLIALWSVHVRQPFSESVLMDLLYTKGQEIKR